MKRFTVLILSPGRSGVSARIVACGTCCGERESGSGPKFSRSTWLCPSSIAPYLCVITGGCSAASVAAIPRNPSQTTPVLMLSTNRARLAIGPVLQAHSYVIILSHATNITGSGLDDCIYWHFDCNYMRLQQFTINDCLGLAPFLTGLRVSSLLRD
jgi:hypothetical protein